MPLNIVICGGGIGGLAAAGYLRANHRVIVLERGHIQSTVDYGLSIASNAYNLLQQAGIQLETPEIPTWTHVWIRNNQNEELQTVHYDTRLKAGGVPSVLTKRSKLHSELFRFATSPEFAGTPAKVLQGVKVVRVDPVEGRVWSEDGQEFECDLVIGADGINSVVREAILEDSDVCRPRTHDLLAFTTQIPISTVQSIPGLEYLSNPHSQAGIVLCLAPEGPQAKRRVFICHTSVHELQIALYATEKEFAERFESAKTSIIKDVPIHRVLQDCEVFNEDVASLFKQSSSRIDAWRIRDLPILDKWFRGKVLLIGDSAHAVTPHAGQGCNITIEDAEALGFLLKETNDPTKIGDVLQQFVTLRKDRTSLVSRFSLQYGGIKTNDSGNHEPISSTEFSMRMHSYRGVEHALTFSEPSECST